MMLKRLRFWRKTCTENKDPNSVDVEKGDSSPSTRSIQELISIFNLRQKCFLIAVSRIQDLPPSQYKYQAIEEVCYEFTCLQRFWDNVDTEGVNDEVALKTMKDTVLALDGTESCKYWEALGKADDGPRSWTQLNEEYNEH